MKINRIASNQKNNHILKNEIFQFIKKNIKYSIFKDLDFSFFNFYFEINYKNIFIIKNNKKIIGLISYINEKNQKILKKQIISNIIKKPFSFFKIILSINYYFKSTNPPKNYLQLMHLILDKRILKITKKVNRDKKINELHKKVSSNKFKGIYASYRKNNLSAAMYYEKNNFKIFEKNPYFCFVKKKLN
tara:strand:- start:73 stop:639 length:567 start_codon:yes stop_codon:yes gene_type:complete